MSSKNETASNVVAFRKREPAFECHPDIDNRFLMLSYSLAKGIAAAPMTGYVKSLMLFVATESFTGFAENADGFTNPMTSSFVGQGSNIQPNRVARTIDRMVQDRLLFVQRVSDGLWKLKINKYVNDWEFWVGRGKSRERVRWWPPQWLVNLFEHEVENERLRTEGETSENDRAGHLAHGVAPFSEEGQKERGNLPIGVGQLAPQSITLRQRTRNIRKTPNNPPLSQNNIDKTTSGKTQAEPSEPPSCELPPASHETEKKTAPLFAETEAVATTMTEKKSTKCPHLEILKLWDEILPNLPGTNKKLWNKGTGAELLTQRWRQCFAIEHSRENRMLYHDSASGLEWWGQFFVYLRGAKWLVEEGPPKKLGIHWILKRKNFVSILDGKYRELTS